MKSDGKDLEQLVAHVERTLSKAYTVETGIRTFLDDGSPGAEFDIIVSGKIDGAPFSWSIECRDRSGKGDAAWIQQLAGRRLQFGHNWVTAVSTTGFTRAAEAAAKVLGIELRVVEALSAEHFRGWAPGFDALGNRVQRMETEACKVNLPADTPAEIMNEAKLYLARSGLDGAILRTSNRDERHSVSDAVLDFLNARGIWANVPRTATPYPFAFKIHYGLEDDHYLMDLPSGASVRVWQIEWSGKLIVADHEARAVARRQYRQQGSNRIISQVVVFEPVFIGGEQPVRLELHRIGDHGEPNLVQLVLKPLGAPTSENE